MKTMTCQALGGPCDLQHHGESADDVIKAQDRHPKKSMDWYRDTNQAFATLPDE